MKIICEDVFYINGRFETRAGKEIRIKEGAEMKLIGESSDFLPKEIIVKTSENLLKEIKNGEFNSFKCILQTGTILYFKSKDKQCKAELLEDLYLTYKSHLTDKRQISIYPSACIMTNDSITIKSTSLNDLFKDVFIKFYGDDGAPSANAFTTFFTDSSLEKPINDLREDWKLELKKLKEAKK